MSMPIEEYIRSELFPDAVEHYRNISEGRVDFYHYTSSSVAISIINKGEIWLRNAALMNDSMEISYGLDFIQELLLGKAGHQFRETLKGFGNGILEDCAEFFNDWQINQKNNIYISCLSMHDPYEDRLGKLSMWRAYGDVALVVSGEIFTSEAQEDEIFSAPVRYLHPHEIGGLAAGIVNVLNAVRERYGDDNLYDLMSIISDHAKYIFTLIALCVKHPGFKEEREWRIILQNKPKNKGKYESFVGVIDGVPQVIYKVNINDAISMPNLTFRDIIKKVVVGPTSFPVQSAEAIARTLSDNGFEDSHGFVEVSNIPWRKNK